MKMMRTGTKPIQLYGHIFLKGDVVVHYGDVGMIVSNPSAEIKFDPFHELCWFERRKDNHIYVAHKKQFTLPTLPDLKIFFPEVSSNLLIALHTHIRDRSRKRREDKRAANGYLEK